MNQILRLEGTLSFIDKKKLNVVFTRESREKINSHDIKTTLIHLAPKFPTPDEFVGLECDFWVNMKPYMYNGVSGMKLVLEDIKLKAKYDGIIGAPKSTT